MRELSLHVLDLVQNSLVAGASLININVNESTAQNLLQIEIKDNGPGIAPEKLNLVQDPFYTTRTSRRIGLGLSLLQAAAQRSGGEFKIESMLGAGTDVIATFKHDDIDRAPLGNIVDTLLTLIVCNPKADFCYCHQRDQKQFCFDTREVKQYVAESEVGMPLIANQIRSYLHSALESLGSIQKQEWVN